VSRPNILWIVVEDMSCHFGYQTLTGAHHHRSFQAAHKIHLPEGIQTIPELFKEVGYYTCNSQKNLKSPG
jgi:arylsulfatase A-like enzyme